MARTLQSIIENGECCCYECAKEVWVAATEAAEEKFTSTNKRSPKLPEYKSVETEYIEWWHKEGQGVDKLTYKNMHKFFDIIVRQLQAGA